MVKILPKRALYRAESRACTPPTEATSHRRARGARRRRSSEARWAPLALAFAQLGHGQPPQATRTIRRLGSCGALGASRAAAGLGDLAVYEGRSPTPCEFSRRGGQRTCEPRTSTAPPQSSPRWPMPSCRAAGCGRGSCRRGRSPANSKREDPISWPRGSSSRPGSGARARSRWPRGWPELQAEPQARKDHRGESRPEEGDARAGDQAAHGQRLPFSTPGSAASIWGAPDLAAGAVAAGRLRVRPLHQAQGEALSCSWTRSRPTDIARRCLHHQGRVREGLKSDRLRRLVPRLSRYPTGSRRGPLSAGNPPACGPRQMTRPRPPSRTLPTSRSSRIRRTLRYRR